MKKLLLGWRMGGVVLKVVNMEMIAVGCFVLTGS